MLGIFAIQVVSAFLLFFNASQFMALLAWIVLAYRKAILEEELLSSEKGFGQTYKDYMSRTGRFLPRLQGE